MILSNSVILLLDIWLLLFYAWFVFSFWDDLKEELFPAVLIISSLSINTID
jgi:hypothetical protein